jgi:hypothetical protein
MSHLFCPACGGLMQAYLGEVRVRVGLYRPAYAHVSKYVACHDCAVASEIDSRTGTLIDLGQVTLSDLLQPCSDEPPTLVIGATSRLGGSES